MDVIGVLDADALNISGPDRNDVPVPTVGHSGLLELVYSLGGPEFKTFVSNVGQIDIAGAIFPVRGNGLPIPAPSSEELNISQPSFVVPQDSRDLVSSAPDIVELPQNLLSPATEGKLACYVPLSTAN